MEHNINMEFSNEAKIEAILFFKSEPVSFEYLAKHANINIDEVKTAVSNLGNILKGRGVEIIIHEDKIRLVTAKEASPIIEEITKEELIRDLGKAGLETLAIVLYKGPVRRKEIDEIRGVNSSFILRNLLIRGLVEKNGKEEGERSFSYSPSFDLLRFLGIKSIDELPEFEQFKREIEEFKSKNESGEIGKTD